MFATVAGLIPRPPRRAPGEDYEPASAVDYLVQPAFTLAYFFMDFSIVRLGMVACLLPVYLALALVRSVLIPGLPRLHLLATKQGRAELLRRGKENRRVRQEIADAQLNGTFKFARTDVERTTALPETSRKITRLWNVSRQYVDVCPGASAAVVRAGPAEGTKVVLLHGNPSWSYMYRHIIPVLAERGFDVYAVDWIGFGMSDKPLAREQISFELQMRTLTRVFEIYKLQDTHILAHDWGGCVALCTLPSLASRACRSMMLLNSFLPPRPLEISANCSMLYLLWLSSQGILDGLLPEELVIRYMAPGVTRQVASGYAAPFPSRKSKEGVGRFAMTVPGMPEAVYRLFQAKLGLMLDGLCPPQSFSSLHEQSRLRARDYVTREFWSNGNADVNMAVVFGERDPLLRDYHDILVDQIDTKGGKPKNLWLRGAGHYAAEERSGSIAQLLTHFIRTGNLELDGTKATGKVADLNGMTI